MNEQTAKQLATGKWRGILVALGVDEKFLTGKNGPCPMCQGKDRWRFTDFEGQGMWICNHCGTGDGFELLKLLRGCSFADAAKEVERVAGAVQSDPQRRRGDPKARLDRIRAGLQRTSAEVVAYLATRGLELPESLRTYELLSYYDDDKPAGAYPAMVAGVLSPRGETVSLHITYVKDGRKAPVYAPRKMLTPAGKLDGCAIRLFPAAARMGVAEGIETALSAAALFKLPVWALVNTTLMEKWRPPEEAEIVTIFGDNDFNYAGHKAAYALAFKLSCAGLVVDVQLPKKRGQDFNDVLLEEKNREPKDHHTKTRPLPE